MPYLRFLVPVLFVAAIGAAPPLQQTAAPTPAELAARLQTRYESIKDFTANFEQVYVGGLLKKPATERGTILLKKPSRVRFTYQAPEKKEFVSDGSQFYSYFAESKTGSAYPLPKPGEESTALLFLAGQGNLARDFTALFEHDQPTDAWHLQLKPKAKQADFDTLTLFIDRRTLALKGFMTRDEQGTNTVRFSNLKENTGLSDQAFVFKFPKGTEMIGR